MHTRQLASILTAILLLACPREADINVSLVESFELAKKIIKTSRNHIDENGNFEDEPEFNSEDQTERQRLRRKARINSVARAGHKGTGGTK